MSLEKNEALQKVPPEVLEEYVLEQIRQFAVEFAQQLVPQITQQHLDLAFSRALYALSARSSQQTLKLQLRFMHKCKYIGCSNSDCALCKHNPHKTCAPADNFDEAYADNQVLRARCEADVCVELYNASTGETFSAPGVEVQLVAIDGEFYDPAASSPLHTIKTLLQSDNGTPILQATGANRAQINGTVVVPLQGGRARLPDVFIADKNDTAKFEGATAGKFALMALAVRRGDGGQLVAIDHVTPAVSNPFVVKTQRALNDYRKSAFPHYKDEITRLRFIGVVSANRLKDARAHLGQDVPVTCVDTVQDLKKLVEYAEANRKVENKLLEMLNMRGRHKHKWDSLRQVLAEKVVYDDNNMRVWMNPDGSGQGLLYYAKQAQVSLDRPAALVQNRLGHNGYPHLQVMDIKDGSDPLVAALTHAAEECWRGGAHTGWQLLTQPIDRVSAWSGVAVPTAPINPLAAAGQPNTPSAVAAAAAAAAAGGGAGLGMGDAAAYPAVLRTGLDAVPAQGMGQQMYPNIRPGGVASHFHNAAAAADQAGGSTPLRHASDVAMSSLSGTEPGGPLGQASADDAQDSAFMRQHVLDNVQRRLQESEALEALRHPSDTSDAGTAAAAAVMAAAAAAVGAAAAEGGNNGHKRSRGAGGAEDEEVEDDSAGGPRSLYHRESEGRHLPVRRASPASGDAPGAAAATAPSFNLDMLPSHFPELPSQLRELPSLGLGKEVAHLLEQLSADLLGASGRQGFAGAAAVGAAAAAGGDQQQQQDQDRGGQRGREQGSVADLLFTNSLSGLGIGHSLLPPTTTGLAAAARALGPTGSSGLALPLSGDMNSLRLLSSLAFLQSNMRTEDSFKQALKQVNLGSPRPSENIDAILQSQQPNSREGTAPAAAATAPAGPSTEPPGHADGPFAAAAAAAAAATTAAAAGGDEGAATDS